MSAVIEPIIMAYMSVASRLTTADELLRMSGAGKRFELIAGELHEMSPAGFEHGVVIVRLTRLLANFVLEHDLGHVAGAETGFLLSRDPDTVRAPDIAFVKKERVVPGDLPKSYWPGAPDMAVEVMSPDDTIKSVDAKAAAWLAAGTHEVWVVHPRWRTITVYGLAAQTRTWTADEFLESPELLPSFRFRVGDVFVS